MRSELRNSFESAAPSYDNAAVLARETGARMDERLSLTKIQPRRFADIGCATGDGVRALQKRYPSAQALAVDYAMPMLKLVLAKSGRFTRDKGCCGRAMGHVGSLHGFKKRVIKNWAKLPF